MIMLSLMVLAVYLYVCVLPCSSSLQVFNTIFCLSIDAIALLGAHYPQDPNAPVFANRLQCMGNETTLVMCPGATLTDVTCPHSKDSGVTCQPKACKQPNIPIYMQYNRTHMKHRSVRIESFCHIYLICHCV